jgi:DNA-binding transcriptional ArsR family regulator
MGRAKATKYRGTDKQRLPQLKQAATLLKHVSDPTRVKVITMLSKAEMNVGAMCHELDMSQPAVSHHLAILRYGGVVDAKRQGKKTLYRLTEKGDLLAGVIKEIAG